MIPANELRIGNWVNFDTHNGVMPMRIESIRKEAISACFEVSYFDDEKTSPIPLTPEVLEKCGFDYTESLHRLGELEIGYDNEDFMLMQYSLRYKKAIILKVKYLHQLQNLYFALTGEELTVKL